MREQWPDVDMTTPIDKRSAAISMVIRFVFRHWLNQSALALTVAGGLLGATVAVILASRLAIILPRHTAMRDCESHSVKSDRIVALRQTTFA
jgi:hypothetical protein